MRKLKNSFPIASLIAVLHSEVLVDVLNTILAAAFRITVTIAINNNRFFSLSTCTYIIIKIFVLLSTLYGTCMYLPSANLPAVVHAFLKTPLLHKLWRILLVATVI